jgi:hypothetical protein
MPEIDGRDIPMIVISSCDPAVKQIIPFPRTGDFVGVRFVGTRII